VTVAAYACWVNSIGGTGVSVAVGVGVIVAVLVIVGVNVAVGVFVSVGNGVLVDVAIKAWVSAIAVCIASSLGGLEHPDIKIRKKTIHIDM
jgi:hypothetical protein